MEDEITALTEEWYHLIGKDHHKDRDCHWMIEERWSYGYPPVWAVIHHGYCYERIEEECKTREEALGVLRGHLKQALASVDRSPENE